MVSSAVLPGITSQANFEPDRVQWASFAGRDFTHRQSVKRKAASWGRR
ncbi:MAG: hypothetical protein OYH76_24870 [Defluviicoccus sp.]|nr:hypothetical protein [Defluviicoccus sp.]MDE0279141.1 hypothetical protein [Defluviicoccus sp.]